MAGELKDFDFEGKDVRQAVGRWRDLVHDGSERPEWFWARQHARINSRIAECDSRSFPTLAWASLAATIAIAASLLLPVHPEKPVVPAPQAQVQISDHDLMVAVERSMNAGVPSSLEPASLLADEMNQAFESKVQSQKAKESRYEN